MNSKPSVLIAFGGNALNVKGYEKVRQKEEFVVARRSMQQIVDLYQGGYNKIIVTHGNGPQVGRISLQQELTKNEFPRQITMDVCVAYSQGRIGYILQHVFDNICIERGIRKKTSTVITQVVVDPEDPAFKNPTKPIGVFYTKEEADKLAQSREWAMKEDSGRGWRRVVPSPRPIEIVEKSIFVELMKLDFLTIGAGGGGIPVIRNERGEFRGIEAVIDKDRTSALLAAETGVHEFVILTGVSHVCLDFNNAEQRPLSKVTATDLEKYLIDGQFHEGSMGPKVEACLDFVKRTGRPAMIAHLFDLLPAMEGKTGTTVLPE